MIGVIATCDRCCPSGPALSDLAVLLGRLTLRPGAEPESESKRD